MKHIAFFLTGMFLALAAGGNQDRFRVAETPWPQHPDGRHFGAHRAVVTVKETAPAVTAELEWRRPDLDPSGHDVRIVGRGDGKVVAHHQILDIDNEAGTVVFGPVTPGEYEIYYFPFDWPNPALGKPTIRYFRPEADPEWLASLGDRNALPQAEVQYFEARSAHDSFFPMEVIATAAEVAALRAEHPEAYWLFPESRLRPIRMRRFLPQCWAETGPGWVFEDRAQPNEYFTWQIGIVPVAGGLTVTEVEFPDLVSREGGVIAAERQICFNLTGSDFRGRDFRQAMAVARGEVGALWCGVDIPADLAPGVYGGLVRVHSEEYGVREILFNLEVAGEILADRGDAESWRMSRLRWLNSKLGLDDQPVLPFTAVERSGSTVRVLNREFTVGTDGFPESIRVKAAEILAAPVSFVLRNSHGELPLLDSETSFTREGKTFTEWTLANRYPGAELSGTARLEQDGYLEYRLTLKALGELELEDAALVVSQRPEYAVYLSGLDFPGGYAPEEHRWSWDSSPGSHSNSQWWLGTPDGGLWGKLMATEDAWMEGAIQAVGASGDDARPAAWDNGGQGGIAVTPAQVKAFSGPRRLAAGEELEFRFALLATPAKDLDNRHFQRRYYTSGQPPAAEAAGTGSNIMTLFHGHPALACINYPFATVAGFDAAVADTRAHGMRTSGYHTTGQVSTEMAELWALRAMPDEARIFPGGDDDIHGFSWDCEHLGDRFRYGWLACLYNGVWDSAINTGGTSRYQNFYAESLRWLVERGLGGIYLDGFGADRSTARRINYALKLLDPDAAIDIHIGNARVPWHGGLRLSEMCRNAENIVYFDTTWAGESYDFSMPPDQWLTEASGLVYGVYGDMLNDPNTKPNLWRGMLYGMATRYYTFVPAAESGFWSITNWSDPAPVWKLWDDFGIAEAELHGYWRGDCPVKTGRGDILASVYLKEDEALVVIGSWSGSSQAVRKAEMGGAANPARLRWFAPLNGSLGEARDIGTEAAFHYDDEALYLDYRIETPGRPLLRVRPGGEGAVWEDDSFELYLEIKPDAWQSRLIQVIVNGNGACLARDLNDPAFEVACQLDAAPPTQRGWSGSLTIPWASLGGIGFHAGSEIAFNLCRNLAVEGRGLEQYSWSPAAGSYARPASFGRLALAGEDATATVESGDVRFDAASRQSDTVRLAVDWDQLGFDPQRCEWYQPEMAGMQAEAHHRPDAALEIPVDQGLFLILRER